MSSSDNDDYTKIANKIFTCCVSWDVQNDIYVYSKMPENVRDFVFPDDLTLPKNHTLIAEPKKLIHEDREEHIADVNGVVMTYGSPTINGSYWLCKHTDGNDMCYSCIVCYEDVCEECFVSDEAPVDCPNKFEDKYFEEGRHKFMKLYVSHINHICNLCEVTNSLEGDWYAIFDEDIHDTTDCCGKCYSTEEGRRFAVENGLQQIDNDKGKLWSKTGFGSINDWIPIIEDVEGNMILFNRNADLPVSYACSSIDYRGNRGYYTLGPEWQIEQIVEKLGDYDFLFDHEAPIKQFMRAQGMYVIYT